MNRFFAGLLFIFLALLFLVAWMLSDEQYRTDVAQDKFYEIAKERAEQIDAYQTAEITTLFEVTEEPLPQKTTEVTVVTTDADEPKEDIVLVFGGDLNLDKNYSTVDGSDSIDASLLSVMQSADAFMLGNLAVLTDGGNPADKAYVFRADTSAVKELSKLGADIVSLANNHSFDYGTDGLKSTMGALDGEKIAYVGAGLNEDSAKKPYYMDIGGKKIAFTAAMRSEKYPKTPEADGENAGVVKIYDFDGYLELIREAKKNADVVVSYAHWGVENTKWLEQEQIDGARAMIDAGADIVVGAHSHVLQTADMYNGKAIFYGLGDLHGEGGLAQITIGADGDISAKIIPLKNSDGVVTPLTGAEYDAMIRDLDYISKTAVLGDGTIAE